MTQQLWLPSKKPRVNLVTVRDGAAYTERRRRLSHRADDSHVDQSTVTVAEPGARVRDGHVVCVCTRGEWPTDACGDRAGDEEGFTLYVPAR